MSILRFRHCPVFTTPARRVFHSAIVARLPTGQHMAADGQELEREKNKQYENQDSKQWNEKLATHSEAGLRAEQDTRSTETLQKETVDEVHRVTEKRVHK
ncbi:hypothetical protein CROQUDRAFT_51531 [Cronartium quercuum f. sp. fusiforme G11]|uniref:Uncharacterized protein n=1 Tax=Cronartium quercuum f. sp. fusiforme G11 TaxID=708437 RepID=A0A9P6NC54_9BASI|nr:hypothetical protein CROQUDRAFT_51531 [Cronartium quercuum f. sp. fusiforme G11]